MVKVVELTPRTAYEPPTLAELTRLREIVWGQHPEMNDGSSIEMFADAMWAAGHFGRTVAPWSGQYFSFWVERAADLLDHVGRPACSGPSFLSAIVGHGDIPYRLPDRTRGQLLEVALSASRLAATSGVASCRAKQPCSRRRHPIGQSNRCMSFDPTVRTDGGFKNPSGTPHRP